MPPQAKGDPSEINTRKSPLVNHSAHASARWLAKPERIHFQFWQSSLTFLCPKPPIFSPVSRKAVTVDERPFVNTHYRQKFTQVTEACAEYTVYKTAWQFKRSAFALSAVGALTFALSVWSVPKPSASSVGNLQIYDSLTSWLEQVYRQRIRQWGGVLLIPLANNFTQLAFASDKACAQQAAAFNLIHRACKLSRLTAAVVEPAANLREYILPIAPDLVLRFCFELGALKIQDAESQERLMEDSKAVITDLISSITIEHALAQTEE